MQAFTCKTDRKRYGIDYRQYLPIGKRSALAFRASSNLSQGTIPIYDRVYLGYIERVRGLFYTKEEAENQIIGGVEYRFPLTKITYHDLSEYALPSLRDYYRDLKFGISASIFYDYATMWDQQENLNLKHYRYGFGMGLNFHVPYIEVFRLDMAFDKNWNIQFIAEVNVAF